jgi:Holliday junction resolvase RusA-like endonuclease
MKIRIEGVPCQWPKENHQLGYAKTYQRDPKGKWRQWKNVVLIQLRIYMSVNKIKMIPEGVPLAMGMRFYLPRPEGKRNKTKYPYPTVTPDLDNYEYGLTNIFKGHIFHDDNQIVERLVGGKYYADNCDPCAIIEIEVI